MLPGRLVIDIVDKDINLFVRFFLFIVRKKVPDRVVVEWNYQNY